MRFFPRTAPTVLPCAARGAPISTGRTSTGPTGPGGASTGPADLDRLHRDRAAPETPWEF